MVYIETSIWLAYTIRREMEPYRHAESKALIER